MLEFIWFFTTAGGQWISFHPLPNEDGDLRLWYRGWSSRRTCNNLFEWEVASRRTTLPQFILLGFSQPESFQSTLRTSMMFSYFLLLLDIAIIILLRRYSDYYVLRASFILLNLVCYVWLGFSSHWIPLWIHFQSSVWNAWRDVKLVLLVFPSNNFQLQRDTAFHWDCVQRSYQWHGISTWTYLRSDFRFFTDVASAKPRTPGRS